MNMGQMKMNQMMMMRMGMSNPMAMGMGMGNPMAMGMNHMGSAGTSLFFYFISNSHSVLSYISFSSGASKWKYVKNGIDRRNRKVV